MNIKQVAIVEVWGSCNKQGLFVNGVLIASVDQASDSMRTIELLRTSATSISKLAGVKVTTIKYFLHETIDWDHIKDQLQSNGLLIGFLKKMSINHRIIHPDGEMEPSCLTFMAENVSHATEQLIDHYRTLDTKLLWIDTPQDRDLNETLYQTNNFDYHLRPQIDSFCNITVGNAEVCIKQLAEGVMIDVYTLDIGDTDSIASTYAFYNECCLMNTE